MYDPSATDAPASGSASESDPFAIPDTDTSTEVPVVLNIADDDGSADDDTTTYVRGKTSVSSGSGTTADDTNVIGGRNQYVNTESSEVLSTSSAAFHDFLRYASVAFAGISIALLLFFYYAAHDTNFVWTNPLWSPNTWEFLFYIGYLQQMQAVSELTVLKTPYFLWDYTDSFAWMNFLIEQSTDSSSSSRRLETIVLGGVVSYADRIGIDEGSILMHTAIGFALIMGILIIAFLVIAVMAKRKAEQAVDDDDNLNEFTQKVHRLRSASIRTLGMCVMVWFFSLYPLSLMASFEISMEVAAGEMADALIVSIIAIVVVCFGVLAVSGRTIMHKSKDELQQYENLATWGSLYAVYTYRSRMFFIFDAVVQIVTGILIGTMDGDPTQLVLVIGIQVLYMFAVFLLSPFSERMVLYAAYAIGMLKVLNFGLAFAFLNSNTLSATGRSDVAHAFIGINSIIIIAWFIRLLVVFSTYIRMWMLHTENEKRGSSLVKGETRTTANSELYASVDSTRAHEHEMSETGTVVLPTHVRQAAL